MSDKTLSIGSFEAKKNGGFSAQSIHSGLVGQILPYVPALMIPGLVNLLALALYTRLLSAEAYGRYVFVLAAVISVKTMAFDWLKVGLFRFFQGAQRDGRLPTLISTTIAGFVVICSLVSLAWVAFFSFVSVKETFITDFWLGLPLILVWALFDQILQMNRAAIAPVRYGIFSSMRAILGLVAALCFIILFKQEEKGVILGLIFGTAIPVLVDLPRWIRRVSIHLIERVFIKDLLRYSMPLTIGFALAIVINAGDRFLLQYFLGSEAVGLYAAGYDLTTHILSMLFMVVHMAGYPLVLRTLEQEGEDSARQQLIKFCNVLLLLTLPASVGLALIAQPFSALILDEAFRQTAVSLIPWIALSTFLMGIKVFYIDLAFQLGFRTDLQIWATVVAAALVFILEICWIPIYGLMGAAYAKVAAYTLSLVISASLSRKVFRLPFPVSDFGRIALATLFMAAFLLAMPNHYSGWVMVSTMVGLGVALYSLLIWFADAGGVRQYLAFIIRQVAITLMQRTR